MLLTLSTEYDFFIDDTIWAKLLDQSTNQHTFPLEASSGSANVDRVLRQQTLPGVYTIAPFWF